MAINVRNDFLANSNNWLCNIEDELVLKKRKQEKEKVAIANYTLKSLKITVIH